MQYVKTADSYLLRLDPGEEIVAAITGFANDRRIDSGVVSGLGSVHHAVLGYFDRPGNEYLRRTVEPDCEIVSLLGNIALKDGSPFAHVHVTLGTRDFQALAGHLFEGIVAATCELLVRALPGMVQRRKDAASGLWLLDL
jgi:predicted DNA-binding protein with PD1-like motif